MVPLLKTVILCLNPLLESSVILCYPLLELEKRQWGNVYLFTTFSVGR